MSGQYDFLGDRAREPYHLREEDEKTKGSLIALQGMFSNIIKELPHKSPLELSRQGNISTVVSGIITQLNQLRSILYRIKRDIKNIETFEQKYLHDLGMTGRQIILDKKLEEKVVYLDNELSIVIHEIEEYMHYWMDIRDTGTIPKSRVMKFFMKSSRDMNYFSNTRVIDVLARIFARERREINQILKLDRKIFYRRI